MSHEPRGPRTDRTDRLRAEADVIRQGGGLAAIERHHAKGRMTARERIAALTDPQTQFHELWLWAAHGLYEEWGGAPSAGVVIGIGRVSGRRVVVVANDATVKAGACFPMTIKKILRAQRIAFENRLPVIYLVDSSGVFLPLQDEVFPDEDDFGRIFRNNAVLSAEGIPQYAAIMGNCVAGGAYLPVLCDTLLMTEGSGLYLAGPALVKAAIGQEITSEDLGGASVHSAISGTVDYHEADDTLCIERLRRLIALLPPDPAPRVEAEPPEIVPEDLGAIVKSDPSAQYDVRDLLAALVDGSRFDEYRDEYGRTLVCGFARLGGIGVGIVANQRLRFKPEGHAPFQFGGVIYGDSADKAARFVLDCNQSRVPLLFLQDVNGFDVGRDAERSGIIRRGAKLVNAVSNSLVPKITLILGHSFGAGHYALCGKAFDPRFLFAWPNARYAVMGADQAARTMLDVNVATLRRQGKSVDDAEMREMAEELRSRYDEETDIRHAAARGWIDAIIEPAETRAVLIEAFSIATRVPVPDQARFGPASSKSDRTRRSSAMARVRPPLRVGNGAGFWGDNLDAPYLLARHGRLDVLTLEYLAELTLAILSHLRVKDPAAGYVADFPELIERLAPTLREQPDLKIVTNAGGLNPRSCAARCGTILDAAGLGAEPLAVVEGDDVLGRIPRWLAEGMDLSNIETGRPIQDVADRLIAANVYLGARPIAAALEGQARFVVTGRVADASLTLGPAAAHFGWAWEDWNRLAGASVAGHIIECGAQATGGLWHQWTKLDDPIGIGYPIAEIDDDGATVITKPEGSGGIVATGTIAEQLVYEIDDPACYRTPDVDVDLTTVALRQDGANRVSVRNASGRAPSATLKLAAIYRDGWTASGMLAVVGRGAEAKARAAGRVLLDRVKRAGVSLADSLVECLGAGDVAPIPLREPRESFEVVLRVSARDPEFRNVERFCREFAPLVTSGPPGIAGYASGRPMPRPAFGYWPALVPRSLIENHVTVRAASQWVNP